MTAPERTRQQLDPAGGSGVQTVTITVSCAAFATAVVLTLRNLPEVAYPLFSFTALFLIAVAAAIVIVFSAPAHAPVDRAVHLWAVGVATVAAVAEACAQWGTNTELQDDWGPICLGIVILSLAPYRPVSEIVSSGILSAIFIGFITLAEYRTFTPPAPPFDFIITACAPVLALSFAAAAFSQTIVDSIEIWQRRVRDSALSLVREFREGIARSVQQDRVTILSRDVLPFFTGILSAEVISDADRVRARLISDSIRRVMVEEVDRSWLENLIDRAGLVRSPLSVPRNLSVSDPDLVAPAMNTDQRTAIRALFAGLLDVGAFERTDIRITLSRDARVGNVRFSADVDLNDFAMRSTFAPYFAVMRAVFTDLDVQFARPALTLRFSYELQ